MVVIYLFNLHDNTLQPLIMARRITNNHKHKKLIFLLINLQVFLNTDYSAINHNSFEMFLLYLLRE
jgi:hypothetical protein